MKLKFKLVKFEKAIAFQVLEQSPKFRCRTKVLNYIASNGFEVLSAIYPQLNSSSVSLRGSDVSQDDYLETFRFTDNEARDAYVNRMLAALREWADRAKEFTCIFTGSKSESNYVYILE